MSDHKNQRPAGRLAEGRNGTAGDSAHISRDSRIAQDVKVMRHADQRQPVYPDPPGADAARLLAALLNRRRS